MHWQELPHALLPDETGRMYSGSAVVDYQNTSGMQHNDTPPIFLFYTAAGTLTRWSRGRYFEIAAAVSWDGGMTFHKYEHNPVVERIVFLNRDPKVVWNPDGEYWIMAIFLDNSRYMLLYSENLIDWTQGQTVEITGSAECPDIFYLPVSGSENEFRWVLWGSTDNYIVGRTEDKVFIPETEVIKGPSHMSVSAYSDFLRTSGGYAAQTFFGIPDGRILQMSWIRTRPKNAPFASCASIPNELRLVQTDAGLRLSLLPAKEIEIMREKKLFL